MLHSFGKDSNGNGPVGVSLYSSDMLYSTTSIGGSGCDGHGCGTVYALAP